jgi:alpha,alpha-trehalase
MNMNLPPIKVRCSDKNIERVIHYIHQFWESLIKQSPPYTKDQLFYLPNPYVVPGGVFQQLFYWDSYFILLGIKISKLNDLAKGIVDNFLYEMKTFGIIPNSSEIAHLSRSQPPFLTSMIKEVWGGDTNWLKHAYEVAKIEYQGVWMNPKTHYHEDIGLNRYFDNLEKMLRVPGEAYLHYNNVYIPPQFWQERTEAESGWDYTSRFHRQCGYFIPVDLNSLLYKYEMDFADFAYELGLKDEVIDWQRRATKRKELMNRYLWNEMYGTYFDYNFQVERQNGYHSLATFFPLWAGLASPEQAERIRNGISMFLYPGGMVTSTMRTGYQWDFPNGWAPLQWIVIKGLRDYGFEKEGTEIATRWINLCTQMFIKYGKLFEKYNVVECNINTPGRYPLQEGFGWTNAIYEKLAADVLDCTVE